MKEKLTIWDREFEIMIPAEQINNAVEVVAEQINSAYTDDDRVIILGILNGSFIFVSDLIRKLNFRVELNFLKLSSYTGCNSSGEVKQLIGLNSSLKGRNVIVVEDIVDSGTSITHIDNILRQMEVASSRVCTLFFKPEAYKGAVTIDYKAMDIGNDFIVGYGLDYNELGRELKDIYVTR